MRWGVTVGAVIASAFLAFSNPTLRDFHLQVLVPVADQAAQQYRGQALGSVLIETTRTVFPALADEARAEQRQQWRDGFLAYLDGHSSALNLGLATLFTFCNEAEPGKPTNGARYLGMAGKVLRLSAMECSR